METPEFRTFVELRGRLIMALEQPGNTRNRQKLRQASATLKVCDAVLARVMETPSGGPLSDFAKPIMVAMAHDLKELGLEGEACRI